MVLERVVVVSLEFTEHLFRLVLYELRSFLVQASPELNLLLTINHHNLQRATFVTAQSANQCHGVAEWLYDQPNHRTMYGIPDDQHPVPVS